LGRRPVQGWVAALWRGAKGPISGAHGGPVEAFDQAKMIASVPGERITFIVSVPAIYSLILRRPEFATIDVSTVRWVGYGGAPIAATLVQALQDAFPAARVFNGYGMTETASITSVLPPR
jgi:acyl-CoA synthetase (AMP-forming)/AMP-acid ligase II